MLSHNSLLARLMNFSPNSERSRLARELHDGLAQELASVGYQLDEVIGDIKLDNQNRRNIREIRLKLSAMVNQVRNEIFDLRSDLSNPANQLIQEQIASVLANSEITFEVKGDIDLPGGIKYEVLRSIRELITNAKRHSACTHIAVELNANEISILDNGVGAKFAESEGFGLIGVKERVKSIGGELEIESTSTGSLIKIRLN
jgi:NarL family two-component system sensor histidine kinase LiaS